MRKEVSRWDPHGLFLLFWLQSIPLLVVLSWSPTEAFFDQNNSAVRNRMVLLEFRSRHWSNDNTLKDLVTGIPDNTNGNRKGRRSMNIRKTIYDKRNSIIGFEITNAIDEKDAADIQSLASFLRANVAQQFDHRSFGEGMGGNDVTYLAPILQQHLPKIANVVFSVAELAFENADAGWTVRPDALGIRTSEHLSYDGWESLEAHKDVGSVYTIMIALKEPGDYDGGEFFLQTSFLEQIVLKPDRLSATVFLSDTVHGVQAITGGQRESFVTELWDWDDAPLGMNRPTPDEWALFMIEHENA